ncbi:fructose bisphosphate aldolase [Parasphingorhabdus sp. DH2-15]|uniref:fructose bisphosphate aldolase n=1 Tax=Parasphingorhabdus sp. DH2-15 TaxID=3444112 RepID=UPI003F682628
MYTPEMLDKIENGSGFIAALDQSGGSTPRALKGFGIESDAYSNDDEMFALIHEMRSRIITSPSFNGDKVLGAILFERTMDGETNGKAVPALLWERGIVPFLKVDKGLEDESDGVQMMKPMPELDALLERGNSRGVFGTKMRSVINSASQSGVTAIVEQQFAVANQIIDHGLMPIIEPEVNIKSDTRAECDSLLRDAIMAELDKQDADCKVMLKLSIPEQAGLYNDLVKHPKVSRMVALSGGFSRQEACEQLAQNPGMIASFSRALLEDLRQQMDDETFDGALAEAIDQIYAASNC